MENILIEIYAVLNILLLWVRIIRSGTFYTPGNILLSFWALVAVCAIPAYSYLPQDSYFSMYDFSYITLIPYLYFALVAWLLISPVMNYNEKLSNSVFIFSIKKVKCFIYIYILCALLSIFVYYRFITSYGILESLNDVRQSNYEGGQLKAYSNQLEHFALLFTAYFSIPAKIIFFFLISECGKQLNKSLLIKGALGLCIVLPSLMEASRTASRGMAITLFIELILAYSFFHKSIEKATKRALSMCVVAVLILIIGYSMMVTMARFGQNDESDAFASLVCYWGQPILVFNSQIFNIENYAWGQRFFYPWVVSMGGSPDMILDEIYKGSGNCFTTIIGDLLVDFSPIGALAIVCLFYKWYTQWLKKKSSIGLSELYVMMFYALFIQHGALVTSYGSCISVLICVVMYYIVRFISKPKSENDKIICKL